LTAAPLFSLRNSHVSAHGATMPLLLWLLGVPLSVVILLMLFGVV
jgi:hypothetical protein